MDEVIRPESIFVWHDRSTEEYVRWLDSQGRKELIRHLGITEVAAMDKEKEQKAMDEVSQTPLLEGLGPEGFDTSVIRPGSKVQNRATGEYLGKVKRIWNVWYAATEEHPLEEYNLEDLEVAQEYTKENVWVFVALDIVHSLAKIGGGYAWSVAYEPDLREIRHQAYRKLGGVGIKITEDTKKQVRETIKTAAGHLGVRLG